LNQCAMPLADQRACGPEVTLGVPANQKLGESNRKEFSLLFPLRQDFQTQLHETTSLTSVWTSCMPFAKLCFLRARPTSCVRERERFGIGRSKSSASRESAPTLRAFFPMGEVISCPHATGPRQSPGRRRPANPHFRAVLPGRWPRRMSGC
jgi:hypothetical protein